MGLAAVGLTLLTAGPWIACWAVVAVRRAFRARAIRVAARRRDTHWPLSRINGWFEMGSALAIVGGYLLTGINRGVVWSQAEAVPLLLVGLYALAAVAAWLVYFPADVADPSRPPRRSRVSFATAAASSQTGPRTWLPLRAPLSRGLLTGIMGPVVAAAFDNADSIEKLIQAGAWLLAGVALGSMLAGLQKHPRRVLSFVAFGATGLAIGLKFPPGGEPPGPVLGVILGVCFGLVNVPLAATYQASLPADARGNGMAVRKLRRLCRRRPHGRHSLRVSPLDGLELTDSYG